jgi:hypothetical protein
MQPFVNLPQLAQSLFLRLSKCNKLYVRGSYAKHPGERFDASGCVWEGRWPCFIFWGVGPPHACYLSV